MQKYIDVDTGKVFKSFNAVFKLGVMSQDRSFKLRSGEDEKYKPYWERKIPHGGVIERKDIGLCRLVMWKKIDNDEYHVFEDNKGEFYSVSI